MSKLNRPGVYSPKAQFNDGPKIVSPQKVELNFNRAKIPHSQSQQNIASAIGKARGFNHDLFEGSPSARLLDLDGHQRPETTNEGGYNMGGNGIFPNGDYSQRPATTADGYGARQAFKKKPVRSEFKIRKMGSLYPTNKAGDFMGGYGNNAETEMLPETTKEDREAVEELERWDNEYKILASKYS